MATLKVRLTGNKGTIEVNGHDVSSAVDVVRLDVDSNGGGRPRAVLELSPRETDIEIDGIRITTATGPT